jgi:hypothetical protein
LKLTSWNNYAKAFKGTLAVLTVSFLFLSFCSSAFSAMDPAEVREINKKAPYHLIGAVIEDKLIQKLSESKDSPSQLRAMTLEILEVNRWQTNEPLRTIEISYTYVPPWVSRDGGKRMDISVGDVIEIWLEEGEHGLEPAVGGDSVNHIFYVEDRPVHFAQPISLKVIDAGRAFLRKPHSLGNAVVISSLAVFFALLAFFGLRKRHLSTKKESAKLL